MRRAESIFSKQERKVALWALLMAGVLASVGIVADQWMHPSIGPDGAAAYAYAPVVGVLDARPIDLANGA